MAVSQDGALYVTAAGGTIAVANGGTGASTAQGAAANLAVPYILSASGIPFIYLSSGSVAAGGGISGITSLVNVYPSAYCWFPANALATAIAAGWYYCTFSTATAGTAFLNTYSSGQAAIPSSPTAVTDGKGAFTSDTTTHNGVTISLPANSLATNGQLRIKFVANYTNSAGTKTINPIFGATTVTTMQAMTTSVHAIMELIIANSGVANVQVASACGINGGAAVVIPTDVEIAVDTTSAQNIIFPLTKNTATDNLIFNRYSIEVMSSGV